MNHRDDYRHHLFCPADIECFGAAHPVVAIDADGATQYWLIDPDHHDQHDPDTGCCRAVIPDHEHTGPLPLAVKRRVWPCHATTYTGNGCRNTAPVGAEFCYVHRAQGS